MRLGNLLAIISEMFRSFVKVRFGDLIMLKTSAHRAIPSVYFCEDHFHCPLDTTKGEGRTREVATRAVSVLVAFAVFSHLSEGFRWHGALLI